MQHTSSASSAPCIAPALRAFRGAVCRFLLRASLPLRATSHTASARASSWLNPAACKLVMRCCPRACCQGCEAPGVRRFAPVMWGIATDDRRRFYIPIDCSTYTGEVHHSSDDKAPALMLWYTP